MYTPSSETAEHRYRNDRNEKYGNDKNDFLQTQRIRQIQYQYKKICKIKTNLSEIRKALIPPRFSTEFPPLYMCCNIHNFGITKRKVMASKLQVTPTKFTSLTADTNKFQLTNMLFITFLNVVLNARLTVACKWLYFMSSLGFSICGVTNTTGNNTQIYTRIQTRMYSYTIHPIKHGYLITARNSAISDDDNVTLAVRNAEVLL